MKNIIAAIAIVLSIGLVASVAGAHRSGYGRHMVDYGYDTCWSDTETNNTVTKESKATWEKFYTDTKELRKEITKKNVELEALYLADKPDTEAIKKTKIELIDLRDELDKKAEEAGVGSRGWGRGGRHMMSYNSGGCF